MQLYARSLSVMLYALHVQPRRWHGVGYKQNKRLWLATWRCQHWEAQSARGNQDQPTTSNIHKPAWTTCSRQPCCQQPLLSSPQLCPSMRHATQQPSCNASDKQLCFTCDTSGRVTRESNIMIRSMHMPQLSSRHAFHTAIATLQLKQLLHLHQECVIVSLNKCPPASRQQQLRP